MFPMVVPDLGVDGAVEVIEVLVGPGDHIQCDDIIAVLESDKASIEVPATQSGIVSEVHVKPGVKVKQGDRLLTVSSESAIVADQTPATAIVKTESTPKPVEIPAEKTVVVSPPPSVAERLELVQVPDIGADAATVIELATLGTQLAENETVAVLESDKATMEVPLPHAGTLKKVLVKVGDKVKSGDNIVEVLVSGDAVVASSPAPVSTPSVSVAVSAPASIEKLVAPKAESAVLAANAQSSAQVHAGPAVRKMAREFGIDLNQVSPSGPKNRIIKEDLMRFTKARLSNVSAQSGATQSAEPLPDIDFARFGTVEFLPRSRIQKVSAKNLLRSSMVIPQVTQFDEADITELEAFRKAQAERSTKEGYKLTLLAFLVKAVVAVLKKYPDFNSSLDNQGENLIRKHYYHIGIAVETPEGLVVPVLKNADQKGVKDIAIELQNLAALARDKKLKPADMQGATFSISSLGGIGGTAFTPLVNWPEVAILGVSKSQLKPVYVNDDLQARLCLPLSLSYDHRVIDGAAGARFSRALVEVLSDIRQLVL
ncbi:MAG TPA: dihydrolipoyllysine-residue acetyltransferase [Pseudomonadales bacterium]|nr:dihydrolipoyllysine-residue acetyltransferase [Pseudomonadales bacterium]